MLCVNTLMRGCVSSFIEFYRLSHRSPICIDRLAGDMFSIAENDLPWIADTLSESEESKRQSKFSLVYQKYATTTTTPSRTTPLLFSKEPLSSIGLFFLYFKI